MADTAWAIRYGQRSEHERLPQEETERNQYAHQMGGGGWTLLTALEAPDTPDWLAHLPAFETMRRIWVQQYWSLEQGRGWRSNEQAQLPPR